MRAKKSYLRSRLCSLVRRQQHRDTGDAYDTKYGLVNCLHFSKRVERPTTYLTTGGAKFGMLASDFTDGDRESSDFPQAPRRTFRRTQQRNSNRTSTLFPFGLETYPRLRLRVSYNYAQPRKRSKQKSRSRNISQAHQASASTHVLRPIWSDNPRSLLDLFNSISNNNSEQPFCYPTTLLSLYPYKPVAYKIMDAMLRVQQGKQVKQTAPQ